MQNKKVIMISYYFPPIKAVGAIRNHNMAFYFKKFYNLTILSTSNRFKVVKDENSVTKEYFVKYLRTFDYNRLRASSANKKLQGVVKESKKVKLLRKMMNSFPFNLVFGEGGLLYILHGFIFLLFSKNTKNSIIYSSFSPLADHYIAYLTKKINKKTYWIADFRDLPYNTDKPNFIFPKFQVYLLKKMIQKADLVTTVSEGLKSHFIKFNQNVFVLRNGISDLLQASNSNSKNTKSDKFQILYTGSLYSGKRDPNLLFKALKLLEKEDKINLKDFSLIYAGREGGLWNTMAKKNELQHIVVDKGFISLSESVQLQNNTQINLLLTWATPTQKGILTGKFFEYLKAKKPIVLLIKGEEDMEFENIMKDLNTGITCYDNDIAPLKKYILDKYLEWKTNGFLATTIDEKQLYKYTWEYQFNEFNRYLTHRITE